MSDGRRLYVQARVQQWEKQRRDVVGLIDRYVSGNMGEPQHLVNELSRLSWLIQRGKAELRMTRTAYDSTDPNNIPSGAAIVGYYPHAWGSDMSKHSSALQVRIDNRGDHADDCHMLDVENGAASVQVAALWVQSWHKLHPGGMHMANGWCRKPIIYCSEAVLPQLRSNLAGEDYDVWAANWSTGLTPVAGCFAKQYTDHGPNGENYDMSVVFDDTWGLEPKPAPAPAPPPKPAAGPAISGTVIWTDNSWVAHARLLTSTDGGHTWW